MLSDVYDAYDTQTDKTNFFSSLIQHQKLTIYQKIWIC